MRSACLAIVLAALALASSAGVALAWDSAAFSSADEQLLFSLTNQDRASGGLNALVNDTYLHKEAEWRAKDMADNNYFSHAIPPDGKRVFNYMQADGYCFKVAGENIGLSTFDDSIATNRIEIAFMNSATHRANIMGTWVRLGVGAYKAADGRKLYAVLFSIPCGASAPTPTPTPKPTATPTPKPTATPTATPSPTVLGTGQPTPTLEPFPTGSPITLGSAPTPPTSNSTPSTTSTPAPAAAGSSASPSSTSSSGPTEPATPGAAESSTPGPTDAGSTSTPVQATTLRVHEKAVSQGPIESFFNALFGGIFGS